MVQLGANTVHFFEHSDKLSLMMDRENALAASWAAVYSVALVLTVAACEHLGISPFYSVPFVIVVLPFVVALIMLPVQGRRRRDGP